MAELVESVPGRDALAGKPRTRTAAGPLVAFLAMPLHQRFLLALFLFYFAKQILVALIFPPFSGHDEVAHYAYIQTVVEEQRVPVLVREPGPLNQNTYTDTLPEDLYGYCRFVLQWHCEPFEARWANDPPYMAAFPQPIDGNQYQAEGVQYAANHPPLYYLSMAPIYVAAHAAGASDETTLYLLRFAAIPFGAVTVLLAYLLVRALFPTDAFLLVTVPAFVALQTQVSYEATMVNNDIVAIAAFSWVLYLTVVAVRDRFPDRTCALLGFAMGLGILAKSTSFTAGVTVGLALLLVVGVRDLKTLVRKGLVIAAPVAALIAPWYIHMWRTYGNFTALPQVLELQWFLNRDHRSFFDMLFDRQFVIDRFNETWGQFGWRLIPLTQTLLWVIAVPLLVGIAGLAWYGLRQVRRWRSSNGDAARADSTGTVERPKRWQLKALALMAISCVTAYLFIIQFGTQFALTQARYFFPVVNAAAVLLMLGWRTVIPARYLPAGRGVIVVALIALNVYILTSYVIPYWYL